MESHPYMHWNSNDRIVKKRFILITILLYRLSLRNVIWNKLTISQLHSCVHGWNNCFPNTKYSDESTTVEEKAQLLQEVQAVYPVLSRFGYNPDLRRTPSNGLHILAIQTCDTNYNLYIVVWSDHWCTVEPMSNLIEKDIYIGLKSEFFEMLHEKNNVGRPFQLTGSKIILWCIPNYKQDKGGFCTVNCVNNIVDYKLKILNKIKVIMLLIFHLVSI